MNIRPATIRDSEALARVHVTAWEESYRGLLPDIAFAAMTVPIRTEKFREIFVQGIPAPYVAELDGRIVGFAQGGKAQGDESLGQQMQLNAIYLLAEVKRQGIGSQLLQAVMADFLSQGASSASVWTLRDAQPARRCYESHGAQLAAEKLEQRPGYDRVLVGYIWPDLKTVCA